MTSRKSFWVDFRQMMRGKTWMWAVSFLTMLVMYPTITIAYLDRTAQGAYYDISARSKALFIAEMKEAVCDGVGFRSPYIFVVLGVVFAVGIFGYVNNRSKVDTLKSLPVKIGKRYRQDYVSGLLIMFVPYIICLIMAGIVGLCWGYMSTLAIKEALLCVFINMLLFILEYSVATIFVLLCGNIFVSLAGILFVSVGPMLFLDAISFLMQHFFKTADDYFGFSNNFLTPFTRYNDMLWDLKKANSIGKELSLLSKDLIVWLMFALICGFLAYVCYRKRPAEALSKSVYSGWVRLVFKLVFVPTVTMFVCYVSWFGYLGSEWFMVVSLLACSAVLAMAVEVAYSFDIKGAVKSWWSSLICVALTLAIFAVFKFDIPKFDEYIPSSKDVSSYAVTLYVNRYETHYLFNKKDNNETDVEWLFEGNVIKDKMYLENIDCIARLAEKSKGNKFYEDAEEGTVDWINVYYRKKSGMNAKRKIYVDLSDQETIQLLNEIVSSEEYYNTVFEVLEKGEYLDENMCPVSYTNGIYSEELAITPSKIVDAFAKDIKTFSYNEGQSKYPEGIVKIEAAPYQFYEIPLYENFSNLKALVYGAFDVRALTPEDIDSIEVTYYKDTYDEENDVYDSQTLNATVTDIETISRILDEAAPSELQKVWDRLPSDKYNFDIRIYPKKDYEYIDYQGGLYYVLKDEIPDWIYELF